MSAPTLRRTLTSFCTLAVTGAMVLTTASVADAAPVARKAAARAVQISFNGTATGTPPVTATRVSGPRVVAVANPRAQVPGQSFLRVGSAQAKAVAGTLRSYGCAGIVQSGGTLQVGNDGRGCGPVSPGEGGVTLDLGALTSSLGLRVGGVKVILNGVTAGALFEDGRVSGLGRIGNAAVSVCLGVTLADACVGAPVTVPLALRGTVNENVLATVLNTLTRTPALRALGTTLSRALAPVVSLRTNVQTVNATTGVITVTGLQVKVLTSGLVANLAVAQAGPVR